MIMIDVMVPPLDESFDFEVDENITLTDFREKIEGLIETKRKVNLRTEIRELFSFRKGTFLREDISLALHGLMNGDRLILI